MEDMNIFLNLDKEENYLLMCKNDAIAQYRSGQLRVFDKFRQPLLLARTGDFKSWVSNRAMNSHRPSASVLRKLLNLTDYSDFAVAMHNNATCATDAYWVKRATEDLTWEHIKIDNDMLADHILAGNLKTLTVETNLKTYDTTTTGSCEKCWKYFNHGWYMMKLGNKYEAFSELLVSRLCGLFGFNTVRYEAYRDNKGNIKGVESENFIYKDNEYFEEMHALVAEETGYKINYDALKLLENHYGCDLLTDYMNLIVMDTIAYNVDRHTRNYGVIREDVKGTVLRMAPNYDNNMSLLANTQELKQSAPQIFFTQLEELFRYHNNKYKLPNLTYNQIKKVVVSAGGLCGIEEEIYGKLTLFINMNYVKVKYILEKIAEEG